MITNTIEKGQDAEQLACDFLLNKGLKILCRNFRCARGEIDLIMEHGNCIVYVEVRYRKNALYGTGAETVTQAKQARLIATAMYFLQSNPQYSNRPSRFDVISISAQAPDSEIDWIQDAFQV